jgi:hypothetical protein
VRPPIPSCRVPRRCVLWCLSVIVRPAGNPGGTAHVGAETHSKGVMRVEGGCEGEGGESARPRARAGTSGAHESLTTAARNCHRVSLLH